MSDKYQLGSLLLQVGVDTSPIENSIFKMENIFANSISRSSLAFTESITNSFSQAFQNNFSKLAVTAANKLGSGFSDGISYGIQRGTQAGLQQAQVTMRSNLVRGVTKGYTDGIKAGVKEALKGTSAAQFSQVLAKTIQQTINTEVQDKALNHLIKSMEYGAKVGAKKGLAAGQAAGQADFQRRMKNMTAASLKDGISAGLKSLGTGALKMAAGGIGAGIGAVVAESISSGIQLALTTRMTAVKSVLGGYINTVAKGVQQYGVEQRSIGLANFILGSKEGYIKRDKQFEGNAANIDTAITELATELSYSRADIAKLTQELAKSGATYQQIVGGNTTAQRKKGLLAQTGYLAEAANIDPSKIGQAALLIRQVKSAYGDESYETIANQILGLYTNTQAEFDRFKFAFQDSIPAAAKAGIDLQDTMQVLATMFRFSTPEVSGTLAKSLFTALSTPSRLDPKILTAVAPEFGKKGFSGEATEKGNFVDSILKFRDALYKAIRNDRIGNLPGQQGGTKASDYFASIGEKGRKQIVNKYISEALGSSETLDVALNPFLTMNAQDTKDLKNALERFSKKDDRGRSTLEALIAVRQKGVQGGLDLIGSSIDNVVSNMGAAISDGFVDGVTFLRNVADELTRNIDLFVAPLENMSTRMGVIFQDPVILENFSRGMENVLSVTGTIIEGWVDSAADFISEGDNVNDMFTNLINLTQTMTSAFEGLFNLFKGGLPLINVAGEKIKFYSAGAVQRQANQEAKAYGESITPVNYAELTGFLMNGVANLNNPAKSLQRLTEAEISALLPKTAGMSLYTGKIGKGFLPGTVYDKQGESEAERRMALENSVRAGKYIILPRSDGSDPTALEMLDNGNLDKIRFNSPGFKKPREIIKYLNDFVKSENTKDPQGTESTLAINKKARGSFVKEQDLLDLNQRIYLDDPANFTAANLSSMPEKIADEFSRQIKIVRQEFPNSGSPADRERIRAEAMRRTKLSNVFDEAEREEIDKLQNARVKELFGATARFEPKSNEIINPDLNSLTGSGLKTNGTFNDFYNILAGQEGQRPLETLKDFIKDTPEAYDLKLLADIVTGSISEVETKNADGTSSTADILLSKSEIEAIFTDSQLTRQQKLEKAATVSESNSKKLLEQITSNNPLNLNKRGLPKVITDLEESRELGNLIGDFTKVVRQGIKDLRKKGADTSLDFETERKPAQTKAQRLSRGLDFDVPKNIENPALFQGIPADTFYFQKIGQELQGEEIKKRQQLNKLKLEGINLDRQAAIIQSSYFGKVNQSLKQYADMVGSQEQKILDYNQAIENIERQLTETENNLLSKYGKMNVEIVENYEGLGRSVAVPTSGSPGESSEQIVSLQVLEIVNAQNRIKELEKQRDTSAQTAKTERINLINQTFISSFKNLNSLMSSFGSGEASGYINNVSRLYDSTNSQLERVAFEIQKLLSIQKRGELDPKYNSYLDSLYGTFESISQIFERSIENLFIDLQDSFKNFVRNVKLETNQTTGNILTLSGNNELAEIRAISEELIKAEQERSRQDKRIREYQDKNKILDQQITSLINQSGVPGLASESKSKLGYKQAQYISNRANELMLTQKSEYNVRAVDIKSSLMLIKSVRGLIEKSQSLSSVTNPQAITEAIKNQTRKIQSDVFDNTLLDVLYELRVQRDKLESSGQYNVASKQELEQSIEFIKRMREINEDLSDLDFTSALEKLELNLSSISAEFELLNLGNQKEALTKDIALIDRQGGYFAESNSAKVKARLLDIEAREKVLSANRQYDPQIQAKTSEKTRIELLAGQITDKQELEKLEYELNILDSEIALLEAQKTSTLEGINNSRNLNLELLKEEIHIIEKVERELMNTITSSLNSAYDTLTDKGKSIGERLKGFFKGLVKNIGNIGWQYLIGVSTDWLNKKLNRQDDTTQDKSTAVQPQRQKYELGNESLEILSSDKIQELNRKIIEASRQLDRYSIGIQETASKEFEGIAQRLKLNPDITEKYREFLQNSPDVVKQEGLSDIEGRPISSSLDLKGIANNTIIQTTVLQDIKNLLQGWNSQGDTPSASVDSVPLQEKPPLSVPIKLPTTSGSLPPLPSIKKVTAESVDVSNPNNPLLPEANSVKQVIDSNTSSDASSVKELVFTASDLPDFTLDKPAKPEQNEASISALDVATQTAKAVNTAVAPKPSAGTMIGQGLGTAGSISSASISPYLTLASIAVPTIYSIIDGLGSPKRKRYSFGGMVPGEGNRDNVPALLMPGEAVINRQGVANLGGARTIDAINSNNIAKFASGGVVKRSDSLGMSRIKTPSSNSNSLMSSSIGERSQSLYPDRKIRDFIDNNDRVMSDKASEYGSEMVLHHKYESISLGGQNYVSEQQFQAGLEMAASRGSDLALARLRNSGSTRRRLGI